MATVGDLVVRMGMNSGNFTRGTKKVRGEVGGLKKSIGSVSRRIVGLGASLVGLGSLAGGLTFGIKLAAQAEQSEIAFKTLLGSGEAAKSMMAELRTFAATTPFELEGLTGTAKKLLAMGTPAEKLLPTMRTLGDATAALGGNSAVMDSLGKALGQMSAKGKVSAEEMNQLAERGIPAWQMLAESIGTTIPEAMKKSEQGAISATQAVPALLAGMNERFSGAMIDQSKTVLGRWSTLKDNVKFILQDIGKGFLEGFGIGDHLLSATKGAKQFGTWIGKAAKFFTTDFVPKVKLAANTLATFALEGFERFQWLFGDLIPELWGTLQHNFGNLLSNMGAMLDGFVKTAATKFAALVSGGFLSREKARNMKFADALHVPGFKSFEVPKFEASEMLKSMGDIREAIQAMWRDSRNIGPPVTNLGRLTGSGFQRGGPKVDVGRTGKIGTTTLTEFGSREAFSAIQRSLRTAKDPQKQMVEESKKSNSRLESILNVLDEIMESIDEQTPAVVVG